MACVVMTEETLRCQAHNQKKGSESKRGRGQRETKTETEMGEREEVRRG